LKQIENTHGHWCICLGQQEHAFLSSVLHFIHITWFTQAFANIEVQFAGCSLHLET